MVGVVGFFITQACGGDADENPVADAGGSAGSSSADGGVVGEPGAGSAHGGEAPTPTLGGAPPATDEAAAGAGGEGLAQGWGGDGGRATVAGGAAGNAGAESGEGGEGPTYACRRAGTENTVTVTDNEAESARQYSFARTVRITGPRVTSVGALSCFSGFQQLEVIDAPHLTTLAPLRKFAPASVKIAGTGLLSLDGLQGATDPFHFEVSANDELLELTGFAATSVSSALVIDQLAQLPTLAGLEALESVGMLGISNNPSLTALTGLEQLQTANSITITNNSHLVDLEALSAVDSIEGDLSILDNASLPTCEAERLVATIGAENIHGTLTISGNDDSATCP